MPIDIYIFPSKPSPQCHMLLVVHVISISHSSIGRVYLFFPGHHPTCQPIYCACQLTCILVCASFCVSNVQNLTKASIKNTHWLMQWERGRERDHPATEHVNWHAFLCVQVFTCQLSKTWQKPMSRINTGDSSSERGRERYHPATKRVNWHAFLCVQVIACQMSETWQKPLSRIHTVDAGNERGRGPGEITRQLNSRFWRWARGSWLASLGLGWQRQRQWQRF